MNETVVETKVCNHCNANFDITQGDLDFYDKISPTLAGQKFQIPTPTLCPGCRQRRRLSFRNERKLYRRICDATQQPIISMYNPECGYRVYDTKVWYGDSWSAMDYGRDFDFDITFAENFRDLSKQVPRPSMYNYFADNSDYCNCSNYQKDCYLTSAASQNEKCMYGAYILNSNNCVDNYMTFECENSYMTIDCEKSYNLIYGNNCRSCSNSYFLVNCINCTNCFDCDGLENVSYYFQNKQLTKEEYFDKINNLRINDFISARSQKIQQDTMLFSDNCSGNHIRNSSNSSNCTDVNNIENCKYTSWFYDSYDCYDIYSWGQNSHLCYDSVAIGDNTYALGFCSNVDTNSKNILYSVHCTLCSDCFGCCGLRNKQYCIFNRQYTKEEYEIQVAKIIQHMQKTGERGEFFHPSLSPFGYNETVAQEYYPLHAVGASLASPGIQDNQSRQGEPSPNNSEYPGGCYVNFADFGYHRSTYEAPAPHSDKIINGQDLPETITDIEDSILQYAIKCEVTGKLFRIQSQELAFYRKHNIPLPRKHPDQRHLERLALRR